MDLPERSKEKDLRSSRRVPASDVVVQETTQPSAGQEVKLVNISLNGAVLIRSKVILPPGSTVLLKITVSGSLIHLEGRVQKSSITAIKGEKINYESAVILDGGLPFELPARLQFLDEANIQLDTAPGTETNFDAIPLPEQTQLWVKTTGA